MNMHFLQFATTFQVVNNKLTKLPDNVIPRIFPTYSSNPKESNFFLYCKYQLLRCKPWTITPNNAWNNQEPSDDLLLINCWQEFLKTSYAQNHVPDWFDKLHNVLNQQEECQEPNELCCDAREEWMILLDLETPFNDSQVTAEYANDWHSDRAEYHQSQILMRY